MNTFLHVTTYPTDMNLEEGGEVEYDGSIPPLPSHSKEQEYRLLSPLPAALPAALDPASEWAVFPYDVHEEQ